MPTVLQGIKELSAMGLVSEVGKNKSTGGRKSAALSITPMYRIAIGIQELGKRVVNYNMFENDTLYLKNCRYEKVASATGAGMHFTERFFDNI